MNFQADWEPQWQFIVLGRLQGEKGRVRVLFGYNTEDEPVAQVLRGSYLVLREVTVDEFNSQADEFAQQVVANALRKGAKERKKRLPKVIMASDLRG